MLYETFWSRLVQEHLIKIKKINSISNKRDIRLLPVIPNCKFVPYGVNRTILWITFTIYPISVLYVFLGIMRGGWVINDKVQKLI